MNDGSGEARDNTGGGDWLRDVPPGDDRERLICPDCGFINYQNPKVVVGSVVSFGSRILMCRRAIEPRRGYWTIPAGYLENHETVVDGAMREASEEALARITIDALLAVYNIPRISQVQLIYRATLDNPDGVGAGDETQEIGLFEWDEIPRDEIAFPSVHWALGHWHAVRDAESFPPYSNPEGDLGDY